MTKSKRGFASMTPERRREVAIMGGKAVKPENRAFSKNKALARKAGSVGGVSVHPSKRSFSTDKALASRAAIKGRAAQKEKNDG